MITPSHKIEFLITLYSPIWQFLPITELIMVAPALTWVLCPIAVESEI